MQKLKITGEYKGKSESIILNYKKGELGIDKEDTIREGKQAISVFFFGRSKNPPFLKKAFDCIDNIKYTYSDA